MTPPKALRYTTMEGGFWNDWLDYETGRAKDDHNDNVFAVQFDNGWIWDRMVGWRNPHNVDCPPAQTPIPQFCGLPVPQFGLPVPQFCGLPAMQEQARRVDGGYWAC